VQLRELQQRLEEWHRKKYGAGPVNMGRTLAKLCEELGELAEAINRDLRQCAGMEAADMVFVLFHIVRACGEDFADHLEAKLEIIEARLNYPTPAC